MATRKRTTSAHSTIERYIVLGLGALIVLAFLYMMLFGVPVTEQNFIVVRLLLALCAAIIGAFTPGAVIHTNGKVAGIGVRAAGAGAFFVLVFVLTGQLPPPAKPELAPIATPDLRSLAPASDKAYLGRPFALILPVGIMQDGRSATTNVKSMAADISYSTGQASISLALSPIFATALRQNLDDGEWLPNNGNIIFPLAFEKNMSTEIAFTSAGGPSTWKALLQSLADSPSSSLAIRLRVATDIGDAESKCTVDFGPVRRLIQEGMDKDAAPARLSMRCMT